MPTTLGELDMSLPPEVSPRLESLDAWGQTLDNSAQAYAREVQQAARGILGAVAQFEEGWRQLCEGALDGRAAEMQSIRDRFLRAFENRLRLLGVALERVVHAERLTRQELPEAAQVRDEAKSLEGKLQKLSARWQTAEDLEDLAAEAIAPSPEKLEAVRRTHGFPQAWYDDDSKPF
jgi:hypothetical protein